MRIFINNVDSYVGKALCSDLRSALNQENRLLGTVLNDDIDGKGDLVHQMGVNRVVTRSDEASYLKDVLSCSLIVYDLHSADLQEVESVIKHLKVAPLQHDTTFVLVSSVNVWARTRKEYVPLEGDEEEPEPDGEGEAQPGKTRPQELTDADLDRRIPAPGYEEWKYLETLALSLSSKERLRPHVVAAGILYGNGETVFNDFFQAAWLTQSSHVIVAPGINYIPCVHVRDVARLVKVVHVRDPSVEMGKYLVAVDRARLTQAEIVQGIVNKISKKTEVPIVPASEVDRQLLKEEMLLDLIMDPSAPMRASSFPWWCRDGLVANLDKVAAEFCKWRNLRPIKMVMMGPPGSGAERLCSMVAARYLHSDPPHFTFDQIVEDAMSTGTVAARKLARKVNKLKQKPGAKLPLKLRTKLVHKRLTSNICRYRGYVLEGYPTTYEEANALFMEKVLEEGEEEEEVAEDEDELQMAADVPEEEGEDEADEEEEAPPATDEDEDEEAEGGPRFQLNQDLVPGFAVSLRSSPEVCKTRIFSGMAKGPATEEEFTFKTAEYHRANLALDGSPGAADFFSEVAGTQVLQINVDESSETEAFQALRVHLESRGQFFNYLKTEEEICRDRARELARQEEQEDLRQAQERAALEAKERELRQEAAAEEAERRQAIAEGEAELLENEVLPLRQYLMTNVVPTLTDGLAEVCKEQPEDPIEFLAQYLFAHAQDIAGSLAELDS